MVKMSLQAAGKDVLLIILQYLGPCELFVLSLTSRYFQQTASQNVLWQRFIPKGWFDQIEGSYRKKWLEWIKQPSSSTKFWLKVTCVGSRGIGKTTLCKRLAKQIPDASQKCVATQYNVDECFDNSTDLIQIWNVSGDSPHRRFIDQHFHGADAVILTYDVCSPGSFAACNTWIQVSCLKPEEISWFLIGLKSDLEDSRKVSQEEAKAFAASKNLIWMEVNSLSDDSIDGILNRLRNLRLPSWPSEEELLLTFPNRTIKTASPNVRPTIGAIISASMLEDHPVPSSPSASL
eukprot:TRINITY_DN4872_c0_g1_i4.p1 TRINITY_DN4872_c0_g1~~TRINITY_DN4872_c0_g1_i4.p1  ORF type:complete len:291 (-),score=58.62 TRINITY_DN4872_c0_g1_i4:54-926(-)